jgi:hypothetical protein
MKKATISIFVLAAILSAPTLIDSAEAGTKRYKIKAIAVCTTCDDTTRVPLETTGKGFASRAECEAGRRDMIKIGKRNDMKITAKCVRIGG